jgi:hypothetical protein
MRHNTVPEKVTMDKSSANQAALEQLNKERETPIEIRQVKYLNNIVEQDHRAIKRLTRPMLGFKSFRAARAILAGIELMHMIRKGQFMLKAKGMSLADQFYALAGQLRLAQEVAGDARYHFVLHPLMRHNHLQRMANWLVATGTKTVVMESTGVYWVAAYEVLEALGLEVILANAREARAAPGRKSDVNDAQWLQRLHARGLLRASFRPGRANVIPIMPPRTLSTCRRR